MEKRFQVFISSTYVDLHQERQEVIRALLELDCIPAGMELFPASDEDAWTLIKRVIEESDYYIVISAGRYGSEHPKTKIGYTEMEYNYAISVKKPIIGFLHANPDKISVEKSDTNTKVLEKLESFRSKMREKVIKEWTSPETLGAVVSRSIVQLMRQKPGIGWIRADHLPTAETEKVISDLKGKILELETDNENLKAKFSGTLGHGSSIENILSDVTQKLLQSEFGESAEEFFEKVVGLLSSIYSEGSPYMKYLTAVDLVSETFSISKDTSADLFYCLRYDKVIKVDTDGDILLAGLDDLNRRMRIEKRVNNSSGK